MLAYDSHPGMGETATQRCMGDTHPVHRFFWRAALGEHEPCLGFWHFTWLGGVDMIDAGRCADVAQLVEQLIRNQQVTGSSPVVGSIVLNGSGLIEGPEP